jgi:hypothetical protein
MNNYFISINRLAEYSGATESGRRRIINEQISPNPFKTPWYQLSKSRIRQSLRANGDLKPIYDCINILMNRVTNNPRQQNDKTVSLEALQRFIQMKLPEILGEINYSIIKAEDNSVIIDDVEVKVAPDLIVKGTLNGKTVIGGIKIHISKAKPFDYTKSVYVATVIHKYLVDRVAEPNEIVMPELCFSLDVFGERIVPAPVNTEPILQEISDICSSIKRTWKVA